MFVMSFMLMIVCGLGVVFGEEVYVVGGVIIIVTTKEILFMFP